MYQMKISNESVFSNKFNNVFTVLMSILMLYFHFRGKFIMFKSFV